MELNNYLDIFRDPKDVFNFKFKRLEEISETCIYILDANILLFPYTTGSKELREISRIYKQLLDANRLFIPSQAVKEFAKNRPNKLQEMYQGLSDYFSSIRVKEIPKYQMLLTEEEYETALMLQAKMQESIKEYQKSIKRILKSIKNFNWDDPVSNMYSVLFTDECIIMNNWNYNDIAKELSNRHKFNLPPAYKDKGKDDGGVGDYIIWKDMLEIAKSKGVDVIFVTGDEKADWFHQSGGNKLYPRYELLQEFKHYTNGKDVAFTDLATLIETYSNDKSIIESIKSVEKESPNRIRAALKQQAIENANYKCEYCGYDASKYHKTGIHFLQIHRLKPFLKDSDISVKDLAVLCPNCHRMVDSEIETEAFIGGSPCQMSGQRCPACKIGIMDVEKDGVECNKCGLFIPA